MSEDPNRASATLGNRVWELPPLILHPFTNDSGPAVLLQGSKAALTLAGMLPGEGDERDDLTQKLLESRFAEVRMLYFVGKDLLRWIAQCVDLVSRSDDSLSAMGIREQSFAALLVYHAPEAVLKKLHQWGVANPEAVFSRALGIATSFREVPSQQQLSDVFLLQYHRFADHLFACAQRLLPFTEITAANFSFELYASGEYSRMLEKQWGE
jgi:hypothetical protein